MATPRLVLASTSPFRKALLQRLGLPFATAAPDVDETPLTDETAPELVLRLAQAKAQAVAAHHPNALIIGSDQVAALDDQILGKPGGHDKAAQQLRMAAGRTLRFHIGLCLLNSATGRAQVDVVPYAVKFRALSDEQIENYLRLDEPYGCAGSFRSERLGFVLFESMQGDDPNALIGLPLIRLVQMLEEEGVRLI